MGNWLLQLKGYPPAALSAERSELAVFAKGKSVGPGVAQERFTEGMENALEQYQQALDGR